MKYAIYLPNENMFSMVSTTIWNLNMQWLIAAYASKYYVHGVLCCLYDLEDILWKDVIQSLRYPDRQKLYEFKCRCLAGQAVGACGLMILLLEKRLLNTSFTQSAKCGGHQFA